MKMLKDLCSRINAFFSRKKTRKNYFEDSFVVGYNNIKDDK